ncbi:MAG: DJ-1/PfpI family protein [Pseudomonadota bacterium]
MKITVLRSGGAFDGLAEKGGILSFMPQKGRAIQIVGQGGSGMRTMAAFVFPGFETLDYFGPIEMLGSPSQEIEVITVAQGREPVPSVHGQRIVVDKTIFEKSDYDLLLIPGGDAALDVAGDEALMQWIRDVSTQAERVMAVCTGTVLLGMTGLLDGRKATTNKIDFTGTVHLAPNVEWVKEARWVEDGKFFTSSGVSAGMDMALAVVADLFGVAAAERSALGCEYEWHRDSARDPFAKSAGLV